MATPTPTETNEGSATHPTLKEYIKADIVASILFFLRLTTIVMAVLFVFATLGIFGGFAYGFYKNALLSSFITFNLRLYQRKVQQEISLFSKRMYDLIVTEDSGHYMLYTFFFYHQFPLSIYLLPPLFYAALFSVNYTTGLLPFLSGTFKSVVQRFNTYIAGHQQDIRRFIAYCEIFLTFVVITNAVTGHMFFLAPLLYYQFLKLRYQSRRNPSVRIVFADLRLAIDHFSQSSRCPAFLASSLRTVVHYVSKLAPAEQIRREA